MIQITIDKTGFPFVKIPTTNLAASWLPFTKIQLEHYISDTHNPDFDQVWYDKIYSFNPRIAPHQMAISKYEGVFLTGVMPSEAKLIAKWMGYDYDLPTVSQWKTIFEYFHKQSASLDTIHEILATEGLSNRARIIIRNLEQFTSQDTQQLMDEYRSVADQMVMRLGVMEYVYENNYRNSYAGQGQPNRHFQPNVRMLPRDGEERLAKRARASGTRIRQYGFRLIQRGDSI